MFGNIKKTVIQRCVADHIRPNIFNDIKVLHDIGCLPYVKLSSPYLKIFDRSLDSDYEYESDFYSDNEESSLNKCFLCLKPTRYVLKQCGHALCSFCCVTVILKHKDFYSVECSLCDHKSKQDNEEAEEEEEVEYYEN